MKRSMPVDTPDDIPCCGVAAVAMIAEKNFRDVFWIFKNEFQRRGHWKGRTTPEERNKILAKLGVRFASYQPTKKSLLKWVKEHARDGEIYMIDTTGHSQVVYNQHVYDQNHQEGVHINDYRKRRKMVKNIVHVMVDDDA